MKAEIENSSSREAWLLIILVGVFLYQVLTARYFYWYDIIFTSVSCLVAGVVFLFLFNVVDGKRTQLNIGSAIKIAGYLVAIAIGAYLLPWFAIYIGGILFIVLGSFPSDMMLAAILGGFTFLVMLIIWGAQNLWEMAKNYNLDYQYSDSPTTE